MLPLEAVELDTSIQCRAVIDTGVVNEYAERMAEGDEFPAIDVFGTRAKCWPGDGWHRVLAAKQIGAEKIKATVHPGGRVDALKFALGANALHGHRRSNADKRRAVEIALREFSNLNLSSRAIAEMCGVSNHMVDEIRPSQLRESPSPKRVGRDGKERPVTPATTRKRGKKQEVETSDGGQALEASANSYLWRHKGADRSSVITRAIETLETMAEILSSQENLSDIGLEVTTAWAERVRKCRATFTQFISKCEERR